MLGVTRPLLSTLTLDRGPHLRVMTPFAARHQRSDTGPESPDNLNSTHSLFS